MKIHIRPTQHTSNDKSQRGFTLIELLVVLGILGALAAVVVPTVSNFVGEGDTTANATEENTVQAAMDLYMADNAISTTTAVSVATNDFGGSTPALYPSYLRQQITKCNYTWDATGAVTQAACS